MSRFDRFRAVATIPSRDGGMIRFDAMLGTQRYIHQEIQAGLAQGIHDFVILKGGRQIGGSTYLDVRVPYHLQVNPGMVGIMVSDDEQNRDYRRDVILEMLDTLPREWTYPTRLNNKNIIAWADPNRSRLIFDYAGTREGSNLGRSRGVNVGYFDEVGSWPEQHAVAALRASMSKLHPKRLYVWVSTARGFNVFHKMWESAKTATTTKAIFAPWWRREDFTLIQGTDQWNAYKGEPTRDEWHWMDVVHRRYGVEIEPGQLFWYRWVLREECYNDEAMRAQEYGCLEEECFQAFGAKFILPHHVRRMQMELESVPKPSGFRFQWGRVLDDSDAREADPADPKTELIVWEEPADGGVYVIGCHPWGSSSPDARLNVVQVFRAWPDHLVQVAEYASESGNTDELAWLCAYLAGVYRHPKVGAYLNVEVNGEGMAVLNTLMLMTNYGYSIRGRRGDLRDIPGSINHHFYVRPDQLRNARQALHTKGTPEQRVRYMAAMRSAIEHERVTLRSAPLVKELAMLRRGEHGDTDEIAGGGDESDARAYTLAISIETWLQYAMHDGIFTAVTPKKDPGPVRPVANTIVQGFMHRLATTGRGLR